MRACNRFLNGSKTLCADRMLHLTGILGCNLRVNSDRSQPSGQKGMSFINLICNFLPGFRQIDKSILINRNVITGFQILHCNTDTRF